MIQPRGDAQPGSVLAQFLRTLTEYYKKYAHNHVSDKIKRQRLIFLDKIKCCVIITTENA